MHKDMRLASKMAGCDDFPTLDAVRETLKTAEARGLGDEDFSAIIKLLDQG
jgi:3-hydroxyisobutyrate dehydrogenase-like beta-hydroxyacid dehydrogenase